METLIWCFHRDLGYIPSGRIVRLFHGVAGACMRRGKDPAPLALGVAVQWELHQLVHVAADEDVAVQKDDALILLEREDNELVPGLGEARVLGVSACAGGCDGWDPLGLDAAALEDFEAFWWEARGV